MSKEALEQLNKYLAPEMLIKQRLGFGSMFVEQRLSSALCKLHT